MPPVEFPGVGGTGCCIGGGWWHVGWQEEGDKELVLWSKVQAAFARWEVSPAIGSCTKQGTCVGLVCQSKGVQGQPSLHVT